MPAVKSISELERLLNKKKARLKELQKRRDRLAAQLEKTDKEILSLAGKAAAQKKGVPRRRGGGPKGLEQTIVDVLTASPQPLTAAEIAEAARQTGYVSKSKDFVALVRQICYRSKKIQTKERGKFAVIAVPKNPRRPRKPKKAAAK
jgi:hypothetical protein